jgi:hypothetical protein
MSLIFLLSSLVKFKYFIIFSTSFFFLFLSISSDNSKKVSLILSIISFSLFGFQYSIVAKFSAIKSKFAYKLKLLSLIVISKLSFKYFSQTLFGKSTSLFKLLAKFSQE